MMACYDEQLLQGPTPYKTQMVPTRYGDTHIIRGGLATGEPLILFHGWNGHAAGMGQEFPFLFSRYQVYMPDIIGQAGKSAPTRPDVKGPAYADWACDVLDALAIERAYIIGISGGGWMTLKCCAYKSERVLKAVAMSSDGLSSANMWGIIRWMLPIMFFSNDTTKRWFLEFTTSPTGAGRQESLDGFTDMISLLRHFKTQGNPGLLSDDELRQINCPLLVLMGADEQLFPPQAAVARAKTLIPGLVAAEIVPNAGHVMTIDQPDFLAERVLRFLGEKAGC